MTLSWLIGTLEGNRAIVNVISYTFAFLLLQVKMSITQHTGVLLCWRVSDYLSVKLLILLHSRIILQLQNIKLFITVNFFFKWAFKI